MPISKQETDLLRSEHREHRTAIRKRLQEFRDVQPERYFYELCYCLLTPQSSARQCFLVAEELERRDFLAEAFDPTPVLRSFQNGYVRFHNTKARRLLLAREQWQEIAVLLHADAHDRELRNILAERVNGLGYKEASHFLRNIGHTDVCIVDRHIIRNLVRLELLPAWPSSISRTRYLDIEDIFEDLARTIGIPLDELDLLLWRRETGILLK